MNVTFRTPKSKYGTVSSQNLRGKSLYTQPTKTPEMAHRVQCAPGASNSVSTLWVLRHSFNKMVPVKGLSKLLYIYYKIYHKYIKACQFFQVNQKEEPQRLYCAIVCFDLALFVLDNFHVCWQFGPRCRCHGNHWRENEVN